MRLAIQISGEFRVLHLCLPALRKYVLQVFPNWEVDFFSHTWRREDDGLGTYPFDGRGEWHKTMFIYGHGSGLSLFQPRSYFLENYEDRTDLHNLPRAYSMFYSIQRANDARKDYERLMEFQYDLVMRYRTDCILNENLYDMVKEYLGQKQPFLCIPKTRQGNNCDGPCEEDSICDWFAIGTPEIMDVYCRTYETWKNQGIAIVPESMLALQLKMYGITEDRFLKRPDYDFFLVEGNGQIRGLPSAGKQSLKSPEGSEER
jgi:hypothetical protein